MDWVNPAWLGCWVRWLLLAGILSGLISCAAPVLPGQSLEIVYPRDGMVTGNQVAILVRSMRWGTGIYYLRRGFEFTLFEDFFRGKVEGMAVTVTHEGKQIARTRSAMWHLIPLGTFSPGLHRIQVRAGARTQTLNLHIRDDLPVRFVPLPKVPPSISREVEVAVNYLSDYSNEHVWPILLSGENVLIGIQSSESAWRLWLVPANLDRAGILRAIQSPPDFVLPSAYQPPETSKSEQFHHRFATCPGGFYIGAWLEDANTLHISRFGPAGQKQIALSLQALEKHRGAPFSRKEIVSSLRLQCLSPDEYVIHAAISDSEKRNITVVVDGKGKWRVFKGWRSLFKIGKHYWSVRDETLALRGGNFRIALPLPQEDLHWSLQRDDKKEEYLIPWSARYSVSWELETTPFPHLYFHYREIVRRFAALPQTSG
ncbi:MAG: hypothetical protein AXA67_08805 [Methylothermaceae bacteria B42]|nr:MAG: hypothetical protein AXA67_08805 [Methylothermaceae bacteria B42]